MMPTFKSLVPSINYVPSRVSGYALITSSDAAGQDLTIGSVQNSTINNITLTLAKYLNKLQVFSLLLLAQVFTLMDLDKDNFLSADELLVVSKLGNQTSSSDEPTMCQAKMMLRMFDEFAGGNGNGKMDYQEFLTFMDYYSNSEKSNALVKKMLCAIFS